MNLLKNIITKWLFITKIIINVSSILPIKDRIRFFKSTNLYQDRKFLLDLFIILSYYIYILYKLYYIIVNYLF